MGLAVSSAPDAAAPALELGVARDAAGAERKFARANAPGDEMLPPGWAVEAWLWRLAPGPIH